MKVLVAAGGTGGHVYPALAIASKFTKEGHEVVLAGRHNSFEERIFKAAGFKVLNIRSAQFYADPKSLLRFSVNASKGVYDAFKILKKQNFDVVIGGGGYVSAPVLFASLVLRKPFFLFEQNVVPGRTNRLFGRFAKVIFTGFPDIYGYFPQSKTVFSGNPVREEIFTVTKKDAAAWLGLSETLQTLLVFGGSGGASALNKIFSRIIVPFYQKTNAQIVFITGKRDFEGIRSALPEKLPGSIKVLPYLEHMEYALKLANFAVARGGAMTLTELSLTKIPAIIVPFPFARDDHQFKNAHLLVQKGCVEVIREKELTEKLLLDRLIYYFSHNDIINKMSKECKGIFPENAADIIYERIIKMYE